MQALDSQPIDSPAIDQTSPATEPVTEAMRLSALLDEIAADAEVRSPAYLRETVVPEGGE